ncbi:MAG: hypothetical protein HZC40_02750 [Chloroflexi bacterium]|nr:hypothetical protein [Chloroflexota bacterium]
MGKRFIFIFLIALACGALLLAPRVAAQTPINTAPQTARYLDNQWHYIPANTTLYFLFDYTGDRSIFELVLADGNPKKLQFNLYTPGQMSGQEDSSKPFGRGSAPMVNCDSGRCPSNHILWKGAMPAGGTFLVEVVNPNPVGTPYFLGIVGSGITLRVPQPQPPIQLLPYVAPTLTATPTITTTATMTPTSSAHSATATSTSAATITPTIAASPIITDATFVLGSPPQIIPEFSERYVSFFYPGERAQIEIVIPEGAAARLMFLIFFQDAPNVEIKFIGASSASARDAIWIGEFNMPGMGYVQVINNNPVAQPVQVIVTGTQVK